LKIVIQHNKFDSKVRSMGSLYCIVRKLAVSSRYLVGD